MPPEHASGARIQIIPAILLTDDSLNDSTAQKTMNAETHKVRSALDSAIRDRLSTNRETTPTSQMPTRDSQRKQIVQMPTRDTGTPSGETSAKR